ncbi:hypothetical protein F4803DRAFT_578093 [Xylaria telfairii]|nr:hypothetical protein F4803DRAFT_578093 [Xylaria telfairii]
MEHVRGLRSLWAGSSWKYRPVEGEADQVEKANAIVALRFVVSLRRWQRQRPGLACVNPPRRHEWRTLREEEQKSYIEAVLCLSELPSLFEPGSSRFDDMAYAHLFEGTITHYAAAFLPFHRYFIHTFEKALKSECGYQGGLPYWDWALDSADLALSPVWRDVGGFSGDGNETIGEAISGGHCVTSGPFAFARRHWQAKYNGHGFEPLAAPHCLNRGFLAPGKDKDEFQRTISSASLTEVMAHSQYDEFLDALEVTAHNSIPQFVRGDFFLGTAPNDPVFYLHHAQVDRLWWLWQQQDVENRLYAFQGPAENKLFGSSNTSEHTQVSLRDTLSLGQFADHVQIMDLMRTDTSLLCYSY